MVRYVKKINSVVECNNEVVNQLHSENFIKLIECGNKLTELYRVIVQNYDTCNTNILFKWITDRQHIFFETTGRGNLDWLLLSEIFRDPLVRKDYHITIVFPYVQEDIITARSLYRFVSRVNTCIEYGINSSTTDFGPYIRDVAHKNKVINNEIIYPPRMILFNNIISNINIIHDNLANLINTCSQSQGSNKFDSIIFYDNIKEVPRLLFDINCNNTLIKTEKCANIKYFMKKYKFSQNLKNALKNITGLCKRKYSLVKG